MCRFVPGPCTVSLKQRKASGTLAEPKSSSCESNWVDFALDSLDHLVSLKVQSGESPQCEDPISEFCPVNRKSGTGAFTGQSQNAREITRVTECF